MKHLLPDPKKIVLVFLVIGCVWIFLSSYLLFLETSPENYLFWESLKGYLFVFLTAGLLYYFLLYYKNKLQTVLFQWQQREDQFKKLYEESPQPTWISSRQGGLLFINKAAIDLFGFMPSQLKGSLPEELRSIENSIKCNGYGKVEEDGELKNIRDFFSRSGEHLYLNVIIHDMEYQGEEARLVVANNVTSLVRAEKEKQQITNELFHYKKALDRSALLSVTDLNGVILDVNNKFCEITKFNPEELIGRKHNVINSGLHPTSFFQNMFNTLQEGKVWRGELCNMAKDGKLFWVDMSIVPVMDRFNATEKYMAISFPVTDRKAAEVKSEKVQQELMTFMYKASHNLRGPVATLSGLLNIARIEVKEHNSLSYINMLNERTKHLEYTLGELIDITKVKQEDLAVGVISFERLVKKVLDEFKREIRKFHIEIQIHVQQFEKQQFRNDPKLIISLLHYLVDNSIKFRSNESPCISIEIREQTGGAFITINDNGPGIDEEIKGRVYEMYFRGSEKSTGSGLGLYIVSSIVERLDGYISLESKPGKGTTFAIFLPDARHLEEARNESHVYLPDKRIPFTQNGN